MRETRMSALGVLFLLLCLAPALTPARVAAAGDQGPLPFHIQGRLTFMDFTSGFPSVVIDEGSASHLGRFFNVGKYASAVAGFGTYYTASGDELYWRQGAGYTIEFTGGTGRFTGASGSFTFSMSGARVVPGAEGTLNLVFDYTGEGTISY